MEKMNNNRCKVSYWEKMINVKYELFDAFVGKVWFYDVRINKTSFDDNVYEVELLVNDYCSIYNINDFKDELKFYGLKILKIYDDNYFIMTRNVKDTYLVKFFVKGIE